MAQFQCEILGPSIIFFEFVSGEHNSIKDDTISAVLENDLIFQVSPKFQERTSYWYTCQNFKKCPRILRIVECLHTLTFLFTFSKFFNFLTFPLF